MKKLEKQGLFHRYAHQDENKACIDKAAKLLDEAIQRFDVSLQPFYFPYQLTASCRLPQTNMQISILLKQQCTWGALVELDGVSRDRHGEVLVASQMTEKERMVCTPAHFLCSESLVQHTLAAPDRNRS
jgi:hypothetical protein